MPNTYVLNHRVSLNECTGGDAVKLDVGCGACNIEALRNRVAEVESRETQLRKAADTAFRIWNDGYKPTTQEEVDAMEALGEALTATECKACQCPCANCACLKSEPCEECGCKSIYDPIKKE